MDYKAAIERILGHATERELRIIYEFSVGLTAGPEEDAQEE